AVRPVGQERTFLERCSGGVGQVPGRPAETVDLTTRGQFEQLFPTEQCQRWFTGERLDRPLVTRCTTGLLLAVLRLCRSRGRLLHPGLRAFRVRGGGATSAIRLRRAARLWGWWLRGRRRSAGRDFGRHHGPGWRCPRLLRGGFGSRSFGSCVLESGSVLLGQQ